jgi:hypothetical protein
VIAFQLLPYRVEVAVDDDRLETAIDYLANGARQPLTPRATMHYAVNGRGPYTLFEEGDYLARLDGPDDVLYVLYQRSHARLVDYLSLSGWVPLHAGVVSIAGRRALMLGSKGAGKTTLMLRLLYDGHAVEGDELVFTRGGDAVCLPRNFHVKPGAPELVPELGELWAGLPTTSTSDGVVIAAFNPTAGGFTWQLERGPIDVGFALRPNHGGSASCQRISTVALVEDAIGNAFPTTVAARDVVRACSAVLGRAAGHQLIVGDVARTAELLAAAVAE